MKKSRDLPVFNLRVQIGAGRGALYRRGMEFLECPTVNLCGADDPCVIEFDRLLDNNDVAGAAKLAAESPQLRTLETVQRFQQIPGPRGREPVFMYFHALLEKGKLNQMESMELARPVLQQGRPQLLEKWLTNDKLECSEQLGDLVAQTDVNIALSVYLRADVPEKVAAMQELKRAGSEAGS